MTKLRLLSLFAGIGGFDLGAEMTGRFETVAFCEINPFARAVLAKHWPNVPCFPDVTKLTKDQINGPIDAICAGFPCQDLSFAGKGAGIEGARSGLWSEVVRLVGEIRPAIVMLENVPAILVRGLGRVLSDLAQIGYNAFWDCIRASDLGAWHRRDRWFLVAYPSGERRRKAGQFRCDESKKRIAGRSEVVAHPERFGRSQMVEPIFGGSTGQEATGTASDGGCTRRWHGWDVEPDVGRVANGVPNRTHRLAALGNAIVPLWAFVVSKVAIAIYDHAGGFND